MTYIKGITEGTIKQISQQDIDPTRVYIAKDLPDNSITNLQMKKAVEDENIAAFYKENNTYMCIDDGEYKKSHTYKFTNGTWEDITIDEIGVVKLTGTAEKPINWATDMKVGELYSCSGYILRNSTDSYIQLSYPTLIYKESTTQAEAQNVRFTSSSSSGSYQYGYVTRVTFNSTTGLISSCYNNASITSINGTSNPTTTSIYAPTSYGSSGYVLQSNGSGSSPTWVQKYFALNGSGYSSGSINLSWYAPTSAGTKGQLLQSNGSGAPIWVDSPILVTGDGTKYLADDGTYKKIDLALDNISMSRNAKNELQAIGLVHDTDEVVTGDVVNKAITFTRYDDRPQYTITNNLTNCKSSNKKTYAGEGDSYTAIITADAGYPLSTATVSIMMGEQDITQTAYNNGIINIASVTDDLTIDIDVSLLLPAKGDLITIENQQYRVLKTEGTNAEVVAMFDASSSQTFYSSSNAYFGSYLDTYLNTTYYNTLSTDMKNAIVANQITQYQYALNNSVYNETTHASYADYSTKSVKATNTRNVYALDVEDVEEYFNHTFSTSDIWTLFWNQSTRPSSTKAPWLRSARANSSDNAWYVEGSLGYFYCGTVNIVTAARPAFKIDLTKITFTINN